MKQKYISTDSRTGYTVGTIVELTQDELIATPFNVFMEYNDGVVIAEDVAEKPRIIRSRRSVQ